MKNRYAFVGAMFLLCSSFVHAMEPMELPKEDLSSKKIREMIRYGKFDELKAYIESFEAGPTKLTSENYDTLLAWAEGAHSTYQKIAKTDNTQEITNKYWQSSVTGILATATAVFALFAGGGNKSKALGCTAGALAISTASNLDDVTTMSKNKKQASENMVGLDGIIAYLSKKKPRSLIPPAPKDVQYYSVDTQIGYSNFTYIKKYLETTNNSFLPHIDMYLHEAHLREEARFVDTQNKEINFLKYLIDISVIPAKVVVLWFATEYGQQMFNNVCPTNLNPSLRSPIEKILKNLNKHKEHSTIVQLGYCLKQQFNTYQENQTRKEKLAEAQNITDLLTFFKLTSRKELLEMKKKLAEERLEKERARAERERKNAELDRAINRGLAQQQQRNNRGNLCN